MNNQSAVLKPNMRPSFHVMPIPWDSRVIQCFVNWMKTVICRRFANLAVNGNAVPRLGENAVVNCPTAAMDRALKTPSAKWA